MKRKFKRTHFNQLLISYTWLIVIGWSIIIALFLLLNVLKATSILFDLLMILTIWLGGTGFILKTSKIVREHNRKMEDANASLKKSSELLEQRVLKRTGELERLTKALKKEVEERTKTEAVLKENEERYKGITQSTASCIAVYEPIDNGQNFRFIEINPMAEKVENITNDKVIGKTVTEVFPGVVEFGLFKVFQEVYQSGKPQHFPVGIYKDKRIQGYRENYVYKLSSGEIVAVYQDVTKRKRAEQVQKVLYNISKATLTTANMDELISQIQKQVNSVIDTSNFFVALYNKKTDSLSMLYYSDSKDHFTSAPAKNTLSKYVIETNKSLLANLSVKKRLEEEGKLEHQGSLSKVWLGVPLRINDKNIGVVAVQDYDNEDAYNENDQELLEFIAGQISISIYRKMMEENLKKALEKAKESDRLKSAFLANMSHEIRTPMNGILGFASLLKDSSLTSTEITRYTDIIETSGERMLNIINNLVNISKIEAGIVTVRKTATKINDLLHYFNTFFYPEAKSKNLLLTFTTGLPAEQAIVDTDSEKLNAILMNLIKNSIKYTHQGSIEFGYKLKDNYLEFFVADTGIGIPKDRQDAVFDRFIQADIEDSEVYEGAGLGLAISKAYVEMLGGTIRLESTEGVGSTFFFTIPYTKSSEKKLDEINEPNLHIDKKPVKKKTTFLIVDDEPVSDAYLTAVVDNYSDKIFHASNGKEAVEIVTNHPEIGIIFMDMKMQVMNGYEATREIRKFNKTVTIIAQTAYALIGDRKLAIDAGCNDYISKPADKDDLTKLIEKYN